MQTFNSKTEARKALRAARLHDLPAEFTIINGEVNVTVVCVMRRDIDTVNALGFNARLEMAA